MYIISADESYTVGNINFRKEYNTSKLSFHHTQTIMYYFKIRASEFQRVTVQHAKIMLDILDGVQDQDIMYDMFGTIKELLLRLWWLVNLEKEVSYKTFSE